MSYATRAMGCGGHAPGMGRIEMPQYAFYEWTPSARLAQGARLDRQVQSMASSVMQNRPRIEATPAGTRFWNDWAVFKQQWQAFFGPSRTSTLGPSPTTMRDFVDRYNSLEERFGQVSGVTPVQSTTVDSRPPPGENPITSLNRYLIIGAVVVGVTALAVLGTAVAVTVRSPAASAAARLVHNRRGRRRRRLR